MSSLEYWILKKDFYKICDLLLDAYIVGFNSGLEDERRGANGKYCQPELELSELVKEVGLDPKVVLRRLYCPQQTEENGECTCD